MQQVSRLKIKLNLLRSKLLPRKDRKKKLARLYIRRKRLNKSSFLGNKTCAQMINLKKNQKNSQKCLKLISMILSSLKKTWICLHRNQKKKRQKTKQLLFHKLSAKISQKCSLNQLINNKLLKI